MSESAQANSQALSAQLLGWYDIHARKLPWRMPPGSNVAPDPYRIWMSEVMLQQTTVAAVKSYFEAFTSRWPHVEDLAAADDDDVMAAWAGLGYYARARNLLKCARQVAADGGFPKTAAQLMTLPGIGPYTSAAIASIAFGEAAVVVDGNVERVMARMFNEHAPLPASKPILTNHAASLTPKNRAGDYAQAVMDLGATICTPKNPACTICPWTGACAAQRAGTAQELPKKTPKKPKPSRYGVVWLGWRDDKVLIEKRPEKGLLGGMQAFPSTGWAGDFEPPSPANWHDTGAEIHHVFTHFKLTLRIHTAELPVEARIHRGRFEPLEGLAENLPTAMAKVAKIAQTLRPISI